MGRRPSHSASRLSTLRSSVLSRHLAPDPDSAPAPVPQGATRVGAARHADRSRTAGRRTWSLVAAALACVGLLIAGAMLLVLTGPPQDDGRTGDDGVFSDEIEGGTGGQGGAPTIATQSSTPAAGTTAPGDAGATSDLTGVGGDGSGTGGTGTAAGTGGGTGGTGVGTGAGTAAGSKGSSTAGTGSTGGTGTGTDTGGNTGTGSTGGETGGGGTAPAPTSSAAPTSSPCLCETVTKTVCSLPGVSNTECLLNGGTLIQVPV